jgi:ABC transporter substrate binding protein
MTDATAGVYRGARQRGSVAARGTSAAARARAAHRRAHARSRGRCGISGLGRGVPAGADSIGLDHRPQRADRNALGHGQCRRNSQTRGGIGGARARRHPGIGGATLVGPLLQATRIVPIVFTYAADPVGAGFVDSLARPGSNATGFISSEYSLSGKWLELLKQIAPSVTRVAVLRNSDTPTGPAEFGIIQATAESLRVEVNPVNIREVGEIERGIGTFARSSNGGLMAACGPGRPLPSRIGADVRPNWRERDRR